MVVKRKAFQMAALVAVGGMGLVGCSGQGSDEQGTGPDEGATSTAAPTAPTVDLEQYAQALVTDAELMGAPEDPPVEGFVDEPVSMYLTLTDFSPTGECKELLDELNSYSGPAVAGISAKFVKEMPSDNSDAEQSPEATQASAQTLIFETVNTDEPMSIYRKIPNACETLTSEEVEDAEAVFTKVPGLDAVHLEIFDGEETETLAVGGASVNGTYHAYMSAEQVSMDQAEEMFGAQAEKLQETFQDEASASPSPEASDQPTAE